MQRKLYKSIQSHIILLLLAHACSAVTSPTTSSTAVKYNDVEDVIQTGLASQFTHGFDRLQVLASPWLPSIGSRSTTQTMGESPSQSPLQHRRRCDVVNRFLMQACGGLVPGSTTPDQAQVHSATSEVAPSEQLSSLDIPQATPPPAAVMPAAVTATTSNNNAAKPTELPGNAVSVPAPEPDQRTALESAVSPNNVAPVRSSQVSSPLQQSTAHQHESSNDIAEATNPVPAPGKTQPVPNSPWATSPALPAATVDGTLLDTSRTLKIVLSPTSERALAVPGTDQPSMPPTSIPTTAPAIHTTQPAPQNIGKSRLLSSADTARDSGAISSINNGTSGQKSSTAANTTADVTALSQPSLGIASTSVVANSTTTSAKSTRASQIISSSASLFPVGATTTSRATTTSSSSASGLRFKDAASRLRGFSTIRLLGYLAGCMMLGARVLV